MTDDLKNKRNMCSHIIAMNLQEELLKSGYIGIAIIILCWKTQDLVTESVNNTPSTNGNGSIRSDSVFTRLETEENCSELLIDFSENVSLYPSELGIKNVIFGSSPTSSLSKYKPVSDASGAIKSDLLVFGPNDIWILNIEKSKDMDIVKGRGRVEVVLYDLFSERKVSGFGSIVTYFNRPASS